MTHPLTLMQMKARLAVLQEEIADGRINGTNRDKIAVLESQAQSLRDRIARQEKSSG